MKCIHTKSLSKYVPFSHYIFVDLLELQKIQTFCVFFRRTFIHHWSKRYMFDIMLIQPKYFVNKLPTQTIFFWTLHDAGGFRRVREGVKYCFPNPPASEWRSEPVFVLHTLCVLFVHLVQGVPLWIRVDLSNCSPAHCPLSIQSNQI